LNPIIDQSWSETLFYGLGNKKVWRSRISWTDCFALAIFKRETQHTQFIGESSAPKYLHSVSNLLFAIVFVCLVVVGRIVSFVKLFKQPNKFKSFKQQLIF
jgi:hypothetical protein